MLNSANQITVLLDRLAVLPILETDDSSAAVHVANLLCQAGLCVIEVVMRSTRAAEVISRVRTEVPGVVVGAGTVTDADKLDAARTAGAQFIVTPGATPKLLNLLDGCTAPVIPGVATVSEALAARERGATVLKVFPVAALGGSRFVGQLASVLGDTLLIPTGGVDAESAGDYLSLPTVLAVGGSWICPPASITSQAWGEIGRRAGAAAQLGGGQR